MAADDMELIEADASMDAAPSLGASLGPLPVVEVELVSASASPAQSGGWAKTTKAGATLRVCRGDSVIYTGRTAVVPREGSHKTGYHVAFRHTSQLFMDDTTSLRVSLRRPVDGGFAVVATASVEWQVLLTAMVQVAPVPDAFTIVPLTYTTPAAGFAGSALLRVKPVPVVQEAPAVAIERVPLRPKFREVVAEARKEVLPPAKFTELYAPLDLVPPPPITPPVLISLMVAAPELPPPAPPPPPPEQEVRIQVMPLFITLEHPVPSADDATPPGEAQPLDPEFFELPMWWEIFKQEESRKSVIRLVASFGIGMVAGAALTLLAGRRQAGGKAEEKPAGGKNGLALPNPFKGGKAKAKASS